MLSVDSADLEESLPAEVWQSPASSEVSTLDGRRLIADGKAVIAALQELSKELPGPKSLSG